MEINMFGYLYALTFVSEDKPGIVAQVTRVLYDKGFNIQDSSSTLLQGVFSMILLVQHKDPLLSDEIKSFFPENLVPSVYAMDSSAINEPSREEHYVISVYGADKPGIVHTITDELYKLGINIVDLQTQTTGFPPKDAYIMILEVLVPQELGESWLPTLKNAAERICTDVTIRKLETYEL
jgi:glycine cleavage system transcriptional repressor